jgi:nitroreductase
METWDAIRARRNVRSYEDRPIPPEGLDRILEAGRRAPSSRNWQPWDFIVVTERDRLRELAKVWQGAGHVAGSAATVALIGSVPTNEFEFKRVHYDLGQATVSMALAATELGIGSCHSGVVDQDLARRLLGHPEDKECMYLLALGYPKDRPLRPIAKPTRRAFDDVVHRERW